MWESKWGVKDGTQEEKETIGKIITEELMKPSNNGEIYYFGDELVFSCQRFGRGPCRSCQQTFL